MKLIIKSCVIRQKASTNYLGLRRVFSKGHVIAELSVMWGFTLSSEISDTGHCQTGNWNRWVIGLLRCCKYLPFFNITLFWVLESLGTNFWIKFVQLQCVAVCPVLFCLNSEALNTSLGGYEDTLHCSVEFET